MKWLFISNLRVLLKSCRSVTIFNFFSRRLSHILSALGMFDNMSILYADVMLGNKNYISNKITGIKNIYRLLFCSVLLNIF